MPESSQRHGSLPFWLCLAYIVPLDSRRSIQVISLCLALENDDAIKVYDRRMTQFHRRDEKLLHWSEREGKI